MNWWNLLRIGECTLKNIVGKFLDNAIFRGDFIEFFYIYIYFRYLNVDMIENASIYQIDVVCIVLFQLYILRIVK